MMLADRTVVESRAVTNPVNEYERALVEEAREDPAAAGVLYDQHFKVIFRYVYRAIMDTQLAEDLTANTFAAAFENLKKFRWRNVSFRAWLYKIATNEIRSVYRKGKKIRFLSLEQRQGEDNVAAALRTHGPSAEAQLAQAEAIDRMKSALDELKPKYRIAIVLRYFEDKSIPEIAEILGMRQGTVYSQLHRGLAQLNRRLVRMGVLDANQ